MSDPCTGLDATTIRRCAELCGTRAGDHWHDFKDAASPHRGDVRLAAASDEAEACERAILALLPADESSIKEGT